MLISFLSGYCSYVSSYTEPTEGHPTVTIDSGVVIGRETSLPPSLATVNHFLGIPFSESALRFSPPEAVKSWKSAFDASSYGPACIQQFNYPQRSRDDLRKWANTLGPAAGESDDSNSLAGYDGSSLAANQDVVVVTINYRTNVFGFANSPNLPKPERNLGLLDQRLALDWVQRNIAAFGGDPSRVTIAGESAGAMSVDALVTNPPVPLSFRAAILQSGQTSFSISGGSEASWSMLLNVTNCSPNRDLERLPRLNSTVKHSQIARVPVMLGSNGGESRTFVGTLNLTAPLSMLLRETKSDLWQETVDAYPVGEPGIATQADRISKIITDLQFDCPAQLMADDNASVGISAWRYLYNASFSNTQLYLEPEATVTQKEVNRIMQKACADFVKEPYYGPGWAAVPSVALFSNGRKVTVDSTVFDARCQLYQSLYDLRK
ncbi:Alpha/Beta hydrolase protein [Aspergillus novoparasiticus]|uniref:Carboxylic ester hydrolase n=1 Tax=Aspergillus novoparasiticus TaxID=986946 RepID=A0A5N6E6Q8_9EURO|nr:Alpha/Beta hydrolase protein [Aspergillus novoparasiticus]